MIKTLGATDLTLEVDGKISGASRIVRIGNIVNVYLYISEIELSTHVPCLYIPYGFRPAETNYFLGAGDLTFNNIRFILITKEGCVTNGHGGVFSALAVSCTYVTNDDFPQ